MAYPESCFTKLIGIRGVCEPKEGALFWLDSIPGIDLDGLAQIATPDAPSGAKLGEKLIESVASILAADLQGIYDSHYKVESVMVTGCSNCSFLGNFASGIERGVLIKDNTSSNFSRLVVDKVIVRLNAAGTFHVVLDDGSPDNVFVIEHDFAADVDAILVNIGYTTRRKQVRVYLQETDVAMAQLSCPRVGSGCGCSGKVHVIDDLVYTGTLNGAETQQAYGFQPCAFIQCDPDDLLCWIAMSAPRMIGMAYLYKLAEQYFMGAFMSTRNNKVAGMSVDEKKERAEYYGELYQNKLVGKETRGLKDVVAETLGSIADVCIVCDALNRTQWATG